MWCAAIVLVLSFLRETLSAPVEKPVLLFSCPRNAECYASPPNCVDDCNAAVSMRHSNGTTTFNITMLSGLQGYVALLMRNNKKDFVQKNQFENKLKDMEDKKDDDDDDDKKDSDEV
ncbi:hypothetical protein OESDEN_02483 [Oesophagostomum dentatum]|uniref:WAP domain-containing protein n=1 Tax=Oesophagostomum dentatum TaxID=61180 RepID=A0A0B1TJ25_OESDE|nr:hypothetical protein OESDEN_02483 [Oesophagostomum dentatum]